MTHLESYKQTLTAQYATLDKLLKELPRNHLYFRLVGNTDHIKHSFENYMIALNSGDANLMKEEIFMMNEMINDLKQNNMTNLKNITTADLLRELYNRDDVIICQHYTKEHAKQYLEDKSRLEEFWEYVNESAEDFSFLCDEELEKLSHYFKWETIEIKEEDNE